MTIPDLKTLTSIDRIANAVHDCTACPLHKGRLVAVPGEGNPRAELLFIGEGPGKKEDETGRPFVGSAGKFLEEMLAGIGLQRTDVFITNIVKCRPPGNRDPEPSEVMTCTDFYLFRQIELINPKLIVTLGRHSMGQFLPTPQFTIGKVHGQPKRLKNGLVIMPLFHPAAALYANNLRQTLIRDFKKIPKVLAKL